MAPSLLRPALVSRPRVLTAFNAVAVAASCSQEEVDAAIATHLDAELEASMAQIKASFSPYSVYVRTERKRSGEHEAEISRLAAELGEIADEIKALNGGGS